MPASRNQQIADALVAQQIEDGRRETAHRLAVWDALAVLEAEILAALKVADPTAFVFLRRQQRAVQDVMENEISPRITVRYDRIAAETTRMLLRLAKQEIQVVEEILNADPEEENVEVTPPQSEVEAKVEDTLIPTATQPTDQSATGAEWWRRQGAALAQTIGDQLLVSLALGEPLTAMTARIRGTSEHGFQDGLIYRAKTNAARLVRTQVTNAVSEARVAVAAANPQRLVLMHSSVLDSRTSLQCLGRHGLRYTADTHEPLNHSMPYLTGPPYHPACRSVMALVLADGGAVAREDAAAWLRRRDAAYQDRVLGPRRAQWFRAGMLTSLHDLLDAMTGRPLTLEEMRA